MKHFSKNSVQALSHSVVEFISSTEPPTYENIKYDPNLPTYVSIDFGYRVGCSVVAQVQQNSREKTPYISLTKSGKRT